MIDFNAFSHGQVQSKLWLCENIEPFLPQQAQVLVIGSWYNLTGFMLLSRMPERYNMILGIDEDQEAVDTADKLMNGWMIGTENKIRNSCRTIESFDHKELGYNNVIINTSCEHMSHNWYHNVNPYQLICVQTSNMVTDDPGWNITNPNSSMDEFKAKYPLGQILFEGEKVFDYGHLRYSRYMIIGRL